MKEYSKEVEDWFKKTKRHGPLEWFVVIAISAPWIYWMIILIIWEVNK